MTQNTGQLAENMKPLVLASASPRRHRLLSETGFSFEVVSSGVDETPPADRIPEDIAEDLARRKARAVGGDLERGTIIGADTIVVAKDGRLLGKPGDADEARATLGCLSGTTHRVITGVALLHRPSGTLCSGHETTRVTMREMSKGEIQEYVESGEPFGKAGAYAIQEHADRFVTSIEGEYDNVVGFPCRMFLSLLNNLTQKIEASEGLH